MTVGEQLHEVYLADDGGPDECTDECPACHYEGNVCPVDPSPGGCDICWPDDIEVSP